MVTASTVNMVTHHPPTKAVIRSIMIAPRCLPLRPTHMVSTSLHHGIQAPPPRALRVILDRAENGTGLGDGGGQPVVNFVYVISAESH